MLSRRSALGALAGLFGTSLLGCRRGRTLSFYNWGDYLAPELIDRFAARESGVELVQDFYLSEAEMEAKLEAGSTHDLAVPIDYLLGSLHRKALLRELSPLPAGVEHLAADRQPWTDEHGGVHAIPYLWGTTGIGYDSDEIEAPTSWNALFDERWAGRISVIDSKGDVMDQGLLAAGLDINSNDKAKIREVVWPKLRAQKQILRAYDSSPAAALITGQTWIAQIDSGDLFRAQEHRPSLRYVIPQEGAALWVDYLVIPTRARQPGLARKFIEFMLEPENAAINANVLRFATPNQTAIDRGLVTDAGDPQLYPPPEMRAKLFTSENWMGGTGVLVDEIWLDIRSG
jgi:spermidine/putrescine transport system substrate-binding protein